MYDIQMAGPSVSPTDLDFVVDAMTNGWYSPEAYKYVEAFEREFADLHGRAYGLMTPNCTSAVHLVLAGLGVSETHEVIAPECTWIGSTAGISHAHATPVFADIDESNWCISTETISRVVSPKSKAIVAVDLYGNMPQWDELTVWSESTGIPVIEDAAESLGSSYKGVRAGKWGVASVFSFHRTKTLTTGEGGMLLTDDPSLYERCKILRDHGRKPGSYFNEEVAYKYMPSNLQAALGYAQLQRIDELIGIKTRTLARYRMNLGHRSDITMNEESSWVHNGAWATALVFSEDCGVTTDIMLKELPRREVPVRPFFYPLSSLPAYAGNGSGGAAKNPTAYSVAGRGIHLPCAMNLTDSQIDYISEMVLEVLDECHSQR